MKIEFYLIKIYYCIYPSYNKPLKNNNQNLCNMKKK